MLKARSKRTISIFLLSAAFCLFLLSCENPFMQKILDFKTVSFNTNGGSSVPAQNLIKGWKITRPDDPVKFEFIFGGWYKDNDTFMYEWDFDDVPAADMILHAKWIFDEKIQITFAAVTVTAPEVDQIPAAGAEPDGEGGANYSIVAVSWSPAHNLFLQNTRYTVSVTLLVNEGYTFRDLADALINGQAAELSDNTGRTVTLSFTFEPTDIIFDFDLQGEVDKYSGANGNMTIKVPGSLSLIKNITVPANTDGHTLTITSDSSGLHTIYRDHTDKKDDNGLFIVSSGAKLIFENIVINGNKSTHIGNTASLVRVNGGGELTLKTGAVLKNNLADKGGGVYVDGGNDTTSAFIMMEGEVSGNQAAENGGGVYVFGNYATFTMNGGNVGGTGHDMGNTADGGGGVYVAGGNFKMEGGGVSGNAAGYGGGVSLSDGSRFTMDGGTISGNAASGIGGGVLVSGGVFSNTFNMSGSASVLGNTADNGGGVYMSAGRFNMSGGTISGNAANGGGGVYVDNGTFTVGGNARIRSNTKSGSTPNNVYLSMSGIYITLGDGTDVTLPITVSGGMEIWVGAESDGLIVLSDVSESVANCFHADEDDKVIVLRDEQLFIETANSYTLQSLINDAGTGGTVTLPAGNYSISSTLNVGKNVTLTTGNNQTVTLKLNASVSAFNLLEVSGGGTLTLKAGSGGSLVIDGQKSGSGAALITVDDGTLIMEDGVIVKNNNGNGITVAADGELVINGGEISGNEVSSGNGGGVYVNGGTLTMNGGKIADNKAPIASGISNGGGGVYLDSGTFNMTGGEISNNTARGSPATGGGVLVRNNSEFNMSGGRISHNESANYGGGVAVYGVAFTLSGSAIISDNEAGVGGGGVYVEQNSSFTMDGGTISNNKTTSTTTFGGGGVFVSGINTARFTMTGGEISGNTAANNGGGVMVNADGTFSKTGGIVYGSNGGTNSNAAVNDGLAIYNTNERKRNTTVDGTVRLYVSNGNTVDPDNVDTAGDWVDP